MRTFLKTSAFVSALVLAATLFSTSTASAQPGRGISHNDFYYELQPYGQWFDYPAYGRVWMPRVEAGFQPYATNGHWEMSEYGMTWASDYPWGWAAFHYGRWTYDDYYNSWIWIPDSEWGPAWVTWRSGGGYYGWAPLGPGMGVDISINARLSFNYWTFVPEYYLCHSRVYDYCLARNRYGSIWGYTNNINNYYRRNRIVYASGPYHYDVERVTRNRVNVYRADDLFRRERYRDNDNRREMSRNDRDNNGGGRWGRNDDNYRNDRNDNRSQQRQYEQNSGGIFGNRNDDYSRQQQRQAETNRGQNNGGNNFPQNNNRTEQPQRQAPSVTPPAQSTPTPDRNERSNGRWADRGGDAQPRVERQQVPSAQPDNNWNNRSRGNAESSQPRNSDNGGGNNRRGNAYESPNNGGGEGRGRRGNEL